MSAEAPRYKTIFKLASGGMATVWIGAVNGALGFRQLVAIKKPHSHVLELPGFKKELMAEARLASMIEHGNVVDVRDVTTEGDELCLVMDYIEGGSLRDLLLAARNSDTRIPPGVILRIILDICAGLEAAHDLVDENGRHVGLIHRDVSPQNILVGIDGIARVADFGVAKFSRKHMEDTETGTFKGKLAYMSPEYVRGEGIDRRLDVFALGVVLWEALVDDRCFRGENDAETLLKILSFEPPPISAVVPEIGTALDDVIAMALAKSADDRFSTTAAFGNALVSAASSHGLLATHTECARLVQKTLGPVLEERRASIRASLQGQPSLASLFAVPSPMATTPMAAAPKPSKPLLTMPMPAFGPSPTPAPVPRSPMRWMWPLLAVLFVVVVVGAALGFVGMTRRPPGGATGEPPTASETAIAASPIPTSTSSGRVTATATQTPTPTQTATAPPTPTQTAPPTPPRPTATATATSTVAPATSASGKKKLPPNPYSQ